MKNSFIFFTPFTVAGAVTNQTMFPVLVGFSFNIARIRSKKNLFTEAELLYVQEVVTQFI